MHRYKRLTKYVFRQWRTLSAILAITIVSAATAALQPWPMKLLVDYALGGADVPSMVSSSLKALSLSPTPTVLVVAAAVSSLILFVVNSAIVIGLSFSWAIAGQRMVYDLASDLFARLQRLSLLFHSRTSVGDSLSRLNGDTNIVSALADNLLITPIQHAITFVAMICVGYALDPVLATLALTAAPLLGLSSRYFGKRMKRRAKLGREAQITIDEPRSSDSRCRSDCSSLWHGITTHRTVPGPGRRRGRAEPARKPAGQWLRAG